MTEVRSDLMKRTAPTCAMTPCQCVPVLSEFNRSNLCDGIVHCPDRVNETGCNSTPTPIISTTGEPQIGQCIWSVKTCPKCLKVIIMNLKIFKDRAKLYKWILQSSVTLCDLTF